MVSNALERSGLYDLLSAVGRHEEQLSGESTLAHPRVWTPEPEADLNCLSSVSGLSQ